MFVLDLKLKNMILSLSLGFIFSLTNESSQVKPSWTQTFILYNELSLNIICKLVSSSN